MSIKRWVYGMLPLACIIIIYLFSATPYQEQDIKPMLASHIDLSPLVPYLSPIQFTYHGNEVSVEAVGIYSFVEFFIRKGAHFTVYFFLAILACTALYKGFGFKYRVSLQLALVVSVLYACFDEFHQSLTPGRTPYVGDVVIDTIGACAGLIVVIIGRNLYHLYWKRS
ncbi:VanZ like family protein [Terribacillus aidingensis]|uniref:VanZ like family protein n=1 Tax=Terribacillus aidingensis TaxID=586416 RepID=A0A285N6M6_9BACI|nr:VanZ family protein [Terribacillus aidingensis]SNZ05079.1 VanZ like family protein [Terribacillus aidingensis]